MANVNKSCKYEETVLFFFCWLNYDLVFSWLIYRRIVEWYMNEELERFIRKWSWPKRGIKSIRNLSHNSRYLSRDSNQVSPEYESQLFPLQQLFGNNTSISN
jgi:hypothetical protein